MIRIGNVLTQEADRLIGACKVSWQTKVKRVGDKEPQEEVRRFFVFLPLPAAVNDIFVARQTEEESQERLWTVEQCGEREKDADLHKGNANAPMACKSTKETVQFCRE